MLDHRHDTERVVLGERNTDAAHSFDLISQNLAGQGLVTAGSQRGRQLGAVECRIATGATPKDGARQALHRRFQRALGFAEQVSRHRKRR